MAVTRHAAGGRPGRAAMSVWAGLSGRGFDRPLVAGRCLPPALTGKGGWRGKREQEREAGKAGRRAADPDHQGASNPYGLCESPTLVK